MRALVLAQAIQETGTITGAAHRLGYSQPSVSQQLRKIEAKLGIPLVRRVGRTVCLTEAGQLIANQSRTISSQIQSTFDQVADLAAGIAGRVRLTAFPSASSSLVPKVLAYTRTLHPDLDITSTECEPPEATAMLSNGSTDIALTFSYQGDAADPYEASIRGFRNQTLFSEPVYVVLPETHPQASGPIASLAALAEDTWVAGCARCRGHLLALCQQAGFVPHVRWETDNIVAVLGMIRAGLGIGLLPSTALTSVGIPEGIRLLLTEPASPRSIHCVTTADAHKVPAISAVLSTIAAVGTEFVQTMAPRD